MRLTEAFCWCLAQQSFSIGCCWTDFSQHLIRIFAQNGFRPNRGTTTQILALRRVLEEWRIRQPSLICIFVDITKAFDSVSREVPFSPEGSWLRSSFYWRGTFSNWPARGHSRLFSELFGLCWRSQHFLATVFNDVHRSRPTHQLNSV